MKSENKTYAGPEAIGVCDKAKASTIDEKPLSSGH